MSDTIESLRKQRAFAWAKYYSQRGQEANRVVEIVRMIQPIAPRNQQGNIEIPKELPAFFTKEFMDMAIRLNKEYTCPVCYEIVNSETIHIPYCAHIMCKQCYNHMKQQSPDHKVKCPTCRKSI